MRKRPCDLQTQVKTKQHWNAFFSAMFCLNGSYSWYPKYFIASWKYCALKLSIFCVEPRFREVSWWLLRSLADQGCTSLVPHLIGPPSHWLPISLVPHLIDPPISTHAPLISLVPHLIGPPDSLVPHLFGPPCHWSPSHWSPIHKSPTTLFELIGPPSHWSPFSLVHPFSANPNGAPSHWSPISLVPHLIGPPISNHVTPIPLVPHLIGPPSHWSLLTGWSSNS